MALFKFNNIILIDMQQNNNNLKKFLHLVNRITTRIGQQNFAIILMILTNFIAPFAYMYVSEHNFSPFQTLLSRGVTICISHIIICSYFGISVDFKSLSDIKYLLIRNSCILLQQIIYVAMFFVISFPINNSILMAGPLFVFVIDYYLNGVKINKNQILGIIIGFVGVLLSINGDLLLSFIDPTHLGKTNYQNYYVTSIYIKIILSFVAFLSNIFWAYGVLVQKKIPHIPGIKISYFFGIQIVFILGTISCFGAYQSVNFSSFIFGCLFSGCILSLCQIMFVSAISLSKNTGILTILTICNAISSYGISLFRYGQQINFICVIGLIFIFYGLYRTLTNKT